MRAEYASTYDAGYRMKIARRFSAGKPSNTPCKSRQGRKKNALAQFPFIAGLPVAAQRQRWERVNGVGQWYCHVLKHEDSPTLFFCGIIHICIQLIINYLQPPAVPMPQKHPRFSPFSPSMPKCHFPLFFRGVRGEGQLRLGGRHHRHRRAARCGGQGIARPGFDGADQFRVQVSHGADHHQSGAGGCPQGGAEFRSAHRRRDARTKRGRSMVLSCFKTRG